MKLHDRFVCRREGCDPGAPPTGGLMQFVTSYIVPCRRCGKAIEVIVGGDGGSGAASYPASGDTEEGSL